MLGTGDETPKVKRRTIRNLPLDPAKRHNPGRLASASAPPTAPGARPVLIVCRRIDRVRVERNRMSVARAKNGAWGRSGGSAAQKSFLSSRRVI
jgi:hypothetical protein